MQRGRYIYVLRLAIVYSAGCGLLVVEVLVRLVRDGFMEYGAAALEGSG